MNDPPADIEAMQSTTQPEPPPSLSRRRVGALSAFRAWWRIPLPKWWTLGVGLVGLYGFAYNFRPHVVIQASTGLDEHDPTNTVLLVTNAGPWTLDKIVEYCTIFFEQGPISVVTARQDKGANTLINGVAVFGGMPTIPPGLPIAQQCITPGAASLPPQNPERLRMNFAIRYGLPWVPWVTWVNTQHFAVRSSPDHTRFVLIPDLPSKADAEYLERRILNVRPR